jgi:hypothetical protein
MTKDQLSDEIAALYIEQVELNAKLNKNKEKVDELLEKYHQLNNK